MAEYSVTYEIGTSAETNAAPTQPDRLVEIYNHDTTNVVWVALMTGVTAVASADECMPCPPGRSYVRWAVEYSMIAVGGSVTVTLTSGMDRGL